MNHNGEHTVVYVAEQSHASFPSDNLCDTIGLTNSDNCGGTPFLWTFASDSRSPFNERLEHVADVELGRFLPAYPGGELNTGERARPTEPWLSYPWR